MKGWTASKCRSVPDRVKVAIESGVFPVPVFAHVCRDDNSYLRLDKRHRSLLQFALLCSDSMADEVSAPIPKHPIAPKVAAGPKKPHIGPAFEDYAKAHAQTIGPQSDEWWAKVSLTF